MCIASFLLYILDHEKDLSILSPFLGSGIRVNELVSLRMRDWDFHKNLIHVVRKGEKISSLIPHELRPIYATKLMEETKDIHLLMRQLGHASTTTAALYSNPEQEKAKQINIF